MAPRGPAGPPPPRREYDSYRPAVDAMQRRDYERRASPPRPRPNPPLHSSYPPPHAPKGPRLPPLDTLVSSTPVATAPQSATPCALSANPQSSTPQSSSAPCPPKSATEPLMTAPMSRNTRTESLQMLLDAQYRQVWASLRLNDLRNAYERAQKDFESKSKTFQTLAPAQRESFAPYKELKLKLEQAKDEWEKAQAADEQARDQVRQSASAFQDATEDNAASKQPHLLPEDVERLKAANEELAKENAKSKAQIQSLQDRDKHRQLAMTKMQADQTKLERQLVEVQSQFKTITANMAPAAARLSQLENWRDGEMNQINRVWQQTLTERVEALEVEQKASQQVMAQNLGSLTTRLESKVASVQASPVDQGLLQAAVDKQGEDLCALRKELGEMAEAALEQGYSNSTDIKDLSSRLEAIAKDRLDAFTTVQANEDLRDTLKAVQARVMSLAENDLGQSTLSHGLPLWQFLDMKEAAFDEAMEEIHARLAKIETAKQHGGPAENTRASTVPLDGMSGALATVLDSRRSSSAASAPAAPLHTSTASHPSSPVLSQDEQKRLLDPIYQLHNNGMVVLSGRMESLREEFKAFAKNTNQGIHNLHSNQSSPAMLQAITNSILARYKEDMTFQKISGIVEVYPALQSFIYTQLAPQVQGLDTSVKNILSNNNKNNNYVLPSNNQHHPPPLASTPPAHMDHTLQMIQGRLNQLHDAHSSHVKVFDQTMTRERDALESAKGSLLFEIDARKSAFKKLTDDMREHVSRLHALEKKQQDGEENVSVMGAELRELFVERHTKEMIKFEDAVRRGNDDVVQVKTDVENGQVLLRGLEQKMDDFIATEWNPTLTSFRTYALKLKNLEDGHSSTVTKLDELEAAAITSNKIMGTTEDVNDRKRKLGDSASSDTIDMPISPKRSARPPARTDKPKNVIDLDTPPPQESTPSKKRRLRGLGRRHTNTREEASPELT